jgi:hypothetical protein
MVVSPALSLGTGDPFVPYEYVRPIGSRPTPLHIVRSMTPHEKPKLIVAERFIGAAAASVGQTAAFVGEARRISTLASPNVARVRELAVRGDDLFVFWDFIEGDKLADLWLSASVDVPLELALRWILDVLSGAGAVQSLRDSKQQPMHLAHGELSTATVVVGLDGIARVLHAIARRLPGAQAEAASLGYLAPEVHNGAPYDARADVFSAGVLLWEGLSGRRLFPETDAVAILERLRDAAPLPATVPDKARWAQGLVGVAAKALSVKPDDRWATPAAMAAEIRKIAGLRLAPAAAASSFAQTAMGERARARRARLESSPAGRPEAAQIEKPSEVVPWSAPVPTGGARRWGDADSSSVGAPVAAAPHDLPEPPTQPRQGVAPESLPPSALNSVVPEPLAADHVPLPAPPLPPRSLLPVARVTSNEEAGSGSDLAAAIDVPVSLPPPSLPLHLMPSSDPPPEDDSSERRVNRRRMAAVLGGVSALGLIVFALAGWRVAHRTATSPLNSSFANSVSTAISEPTPLAPTAAQEPQPAALAPTASAQPVAAAPTPANAPAVPTASHVLRSSGAPHPTPTQKTTSATLAPHKQSAPSGSGRPKPKTNGHFDPNSL